MELKKIEQENYCSPNLRRGKLSSIFTCGKLGITIDVLTLKFYELNFLKRVLKLEYRIVKYNTVWHRVAQYNVVISRT